MFALPKIVQLSSCNNYAVVLLADVPEGCFRTSRSSFPANAAKGVSKHSFEYSGPGDKEPGVFVAVRSEDLKKLQPDWFITKEGLLDRYQAMQREGEPIKDPELLRMAKELWAERLASLRKKT